MQPGNHTSNAKLDSIPHGRARSCTASRHTPPHHTPRHPTHHTPPQHAPCWPQPAPQLHLDNEGREVILRQCCKHIPSGRLGVQYVVGEWGGATAPPGY
jgi:hypothetical protein